MDKLKVKATNSMISANSATTGGSITSENCCEVTKINAMRHWKVKNDQELSQPEPKFCPRNLNPNPILRIPGQESQQPKN